MGLVVVLLFTSSIFCVALLCFAMISYGVLDERAGIMLAYPREGLSYMHVLESLAFAFVWLFYF